MMTHAAMFLAAVTLIAGQNPVRKAQRADLADLQGTWAVQSVSGYQKAASQEEMKEVRLTIHHHRMKATWGKHTAEADFVLYPTRNPAAIDITLVHGPRELQGKTFLGRYVLEDGTLRIAYRNPGEKRPMEMTPAGQQHVYEVLLKRVKK
ncbi:MAG TPA: TIGR03067 domain-containing protein [Gemmataceae bacterium]|nr:TIGR03067 domain-containing protein [Gemmataceae bacterium]